MKASGSALCSAIAAAYIAAHLLLLPPSLEDIDSINFALGLRDFDVASHQPHPPGYPVYIGLARTSLAVLQVLAPSLEPARAEALALAIWSVLAGAAALVAAWAVFRAVAAREGASHAHALWATALLAAAPLFWMTGSRPMSDMPGLAAALGAQALLLQPNARLVTAGAFLCGFGAGVRSQALLLTAPLLIVRTIELHRSGWRQPWRPLLAAAAGAAAWALPLVAASGGLREYIAAVAVQADEARVEMLWAGPTLRRLAFALYDTLVLPWASLPLAAVVLGLAALGAAAMLRRERRAVLVMLALFAPYAAFHVLVQETVTVRYALPLVVPIAWLAVRGAAQLPKSAVAQPALVAAALVVAVPGTQQYAGEAHPAFRAIGDMSEAATAGPPAAVHAHYSLRRPLQASAPPDLRVVEPPRSNEWSGLTAYWRDGGSGPVWFLADARRTDLAVIDPQARRDATVYRWMAAGRPELAGTRPMDVVWYRFHAPGWFAGAGWSLTPELGGATSAAGTGPDRRPIEAHVRRRREAMVAVIGVRHLGTADDGGAAITVTVDGHRLDEFTLDPRVNVNALRVLELAPGTLAGPGEYARLTVAARPAAGTAATPPLAVRQFDIQPASGMVYAFEDGWHEEEYENATGLRWRWSSGRSVLRIVPPQAVRLRLRGESPLKYHDTAPEVRIAAGARVLAEQRPDGDFEWTVAASADDVRRAGGRIAIETDPVYLPGREEGTADTRQLGLRLFEIDVIPVSP